MYLAESIQTFIYTQKIVKKDKLLKNLIRMVKKTPNALTLLIEKFKSNLIY